MFCILVFSWCSGSSTHNEDIMRSKCGGGESMPHTLEKKKIVFSDFREFGLVLLTLILCSLAICLYISNGRFLFQVCYSNPQL